MKLLKMIKPISKTNQVTKSLITKTKSILVIAMFLLLCSFSGICQARSELPADLIIEKNNQIGEVILKASQNINLTVIHNTVQKRTELSWTAVQGATQYKVYQQKQGESEKYFATVSSTSLNISDAQAKDINAPDKPKLSVEGVKNENGILIGHNIKLSETKENGTTYRYRVEEIMGKSEVNGDVVFLIDTSRYYEKIYKYV